MSRLSVPTLDEMTAEQRAVYDATAAGRRGRTPANVMAWLHSPELASRAQQLGEFVRYNTTLTPRLSELAILLVARHCTSQYEWAAPFGKATPHDIRWPARGARAGTRGACAPRCSASVIRAFQKRIAP